MTATHPQTDDAIFLLAICDKPFDNLPRQAYSDWLEETGHYEKALRIRRMIATGREDLLAYSQGEWLALHNQIANLLPIDAYRSGDLQVVQPVGILSRGFIGELHCTQAEFMGGACSTCNGHRTEQRYVRAESRPEHLRAARFDRDNLCTTCKGYGTTTPGFVNQFHRLPITKVVLTDVPIRRSSDSGMYFICDAVGRTVRLPLYGDYFITHHEAEQAVSQWAVGQGRERARRHT